MSLLYLLLVIYQQHPTIQSIHHWYNQFISLGIYMHLFSGSFAFPDDICSFNCICWLIFKFWLFLLQQWKQGALARLSQSTDQDFYYVLGRKQEKTNTMIDSFYSNKIIFDENFGRLWHNRLCCFFACIITHIEINV